MANGLFYEIGLFKNVSESCLQTVLENSRILEVEAGHAFFSAGQTGKELFLLEKTLFEFRYELDYRPDWVRIPMMGIAHVLGAGG